MISYNEEKANGSAETIVDFSEIFLYDDTYEYRIY